MRVQIVNSLYLDFVIFIALAIFFSSLKKEERDRLQIPIAAAALLTPLLAFFSPNLIALNILCFLLIPLLARERVQVVPIYLFLIVTTPMVTDELKVGGVFLFSYSVAHSLTLGAMVTLIARGGWKGGARLGWDGPFFTILLLMWFSGARDSAFSNFSRSALQFLLSYALPYLVVSRGLRRRVDFRLALVALGAAAVMLSLVCVFEATKSWPIYRAIWYHYGFDLSAAAGVKVRSGLIRSPGPYTEPLSLAFALTICILALLAARNSFKSRFHFLSLCAIVGLGILAPQSRGAWIGLLVALFAVDAYRRRWRSLSTRTALLVVGVAALLGVAAVNSKVATVIGQSGEGKGTIDYRKDLLRRGTEEFWKHPIFGDTPANVKARMSDLTQGEGIVDFVNAYLYTALISGFAGLAILIGALLWQLALLWSSRSAAERYPEAGAALAFSFAAVLAVATMISGIYLSSTTLLDLGLVVGIASAARQDLKNRTGPNKARRKDTLVSGASAIT